MNIQAEFNKDIYIYFSTFTKERGDQLKRLAEVLADTSTRKQLRGYIGSELTGFEGVLITIVIVIGSKCLH